MHVHVTEQTTGREVVILGSLWSRARVLSWGVGSGRTCQHL